MSDSEELSIITKHCKRCDEIKSIDEFSTAGYDRSGKRTHRPDCKECSKEVRKTYASSSKEYRDKQHAKLKDWKKEYYKINKHWIKEWMADWYNENKEDLNQKHAEYRQNNQQKEKERHAKYYAENKEKIHQYRRKYYQEHPDKKIALVCRQRVASIFKTGKGHDELLGCDAEFLYSWFVFQLNMLENMTIENHGTYWHIDHVIPCAKWNLFDEEQKKKCFHWTNLAPLEARANISKGSKIIPEHIIEQNRRIQLFSKENNEEYPELSFIKIAKPTTAGSP